MALTLKPARSRNAALRGLCRKLVGDASSLDGLLVEAPALPDAEADAARRELDELAGRLELLLGGLWRDAGRKGGLCRPDAAGAG